jgi:hypothetical protein
MIQTICDILAAGCFAAVVLYIIVIYLSEPPTP